MISRRQWELYGIIYTFPVKFLFDLQTLTKYILVQAWDLHLDGSYYYTIVTNLKSVYWSVGLGAFIGCEFDKRPDEKYTFIVGPKLETELEVFVAPRIALLGRVQQFWNPLSVEDWNTVWNVGIKFLLY